MQKVQNVFPISKLETNDKIVDLAEDRGQIYCRVAIQPTGDEGTLTDAQKALLAKLSEKQRATTLRGQLEREISNVFPVSVFVDYIDGLDDIFANAEYFSEDGQNEVVKALADAVKGEKFIFTYYTESVGALLRDTEYDGTTVLYADTATNGIRPIRSRNNLYFGFFDNEEEALSFMQSRLLSDIEDGNLLLENPNAVETETDSGKDNKSEKPKLTLRRK